MKYKFLILYVPFTQAEAESVFSIQKWMLSGRRTTMTPANFNAHSCMRLKRRIDEVKIEIGDKGYNVDILSMTREENGVHISLKSRDFSFNKFIGILKILGISSRQCKENTNDELLIKSL